MSRTPQVFVPPGCGPRLPRRLSTCLGSVPPPPSGLGPRVDPAHGPLQGLRGEGVAGQPSEVG